MPSREVADVIVTLDEMIQAIRNEIEIKERVFAKLVRDGQMLQESARYRLIVLEAILQLLEGRRST